MERKPTLLLWFRSLRVTPAMHLVFWFMLTSFLVYVAGTCYAYWVCHMQNKKPSFKNAFSVPNKKTDAEVPSELTMA